MGVTQVRKRIRTIREARGLRAVDVAKEIGLSRPFYTQLESGTRKMSVCHLFKIARTLGVTVGDLCGEALEDAQIARMRGHLIPINDHRLWKILAPFLAEELEDVSGWVIVLSEAVEKLKQAEKEHQTETTGERDRMAG